MDHVIGIFQETWAVRALIASAAVGLMCGVLGCFIVLRNMSLIGDALSHAILPGVVFAFILVGVNPLGHFIGAVIAGLIAAVAITWIQQKASTKSDAAIGIVFTAMFSIGVMAISSISRSGGVHLDLKDFLFGNVLGVSDEDLLLTLGITFFVLISVVVFYRYLFVSTFQSVIAQTMGMPVQLIHYFLMLLLSFAVVASLRTVGVILVVAMLITPASTALLLSKRLHKVVVLAGLIGLLSAFIGLLAAVVWNTTPGPAMAVVATLFYLIALMFSPEKGLLFNWIRQRNLRARIQMEDVLKHALRLEEKGQLEERLLREELGLTAAALQRSLQMLQKNGRLQLVPLSLTTSGRESARKLVRAHRLWETYLANEMGLSSEQIHDEAEKYEHLLSEEMLDEVDRQLGFPTLDPHGSPIPVKSGRLPHSLSQLDLQATARIASDQLNEYIRAQLWQLGLAPGDQILVQDKSQENIGIVHHNKHLALPLELARQIHIVPA